MTSKVGGSAALMLGATPVSGPPSAAIAHLSALDDVVRALLLLRAKRPTLVVRSDRRIENMPRMARWYAAGMERVETAFSDCGRLR